MIKSVFSTACRPFSTSARALNESPVSFAGIAQAINASNPVSNVISPGEEPGSKSSKKRGEHTVKYILNCLFTKNNTHFTYSAVVEDLNYLKNNADASYNDKFLYYLKLPQKVKFRVSTGNLGFRKAARGEYEAAFQTSARLFQMIHQKKLLDRNIEIVLKDFGKGREAFTAALNGKEGTAVRRNVVRVSDATPIKFGGVRAPRQRRL
ncbi:mitochondrial 37S ribosomal protein uS11m [Lachancea thermotolerans CBS 6340]|uniref:Small ribosomal subunit protein uS11m n=1 Tax=Lachancea thermotolerans (strain ATCC 56472 / CBS 6340 / NRRL Y-8284) TaxID=559295 RepID=C5DJT2_LACTC|nr:mitochondrial 37S ribosomal protein YmS18 [Lachancea thermotolerans CBS 6340]CAR24571.1 KLTH0F18920p [Lachancea thermotolerans CBS 6340]